jgi:tetratricopeptide (TPR) repeat protein
MRVSRTALALAIVAGLACRSAAPARAASAADPCAAPETSEKAARARALAKEKKHAEAESLAKDALAACASHETAAAALGEALYGQEKYDESVDRMSAVLKARNDVAYAYYWRGMAYYKKKEPSRMADDFEKFLKLAPSAPEATTVRQLLSGLR